MDWINYILKLQNQSSYVQGIHAVFLSPQKVDRVHSDGLTGISFDLACFNAFFFFVTTFHPTKPYYLELPKYQTASSLNVVS